MYKYTNVAIIYYCNIQAYLTDKDECLVNNGGCDADTSTCLNVYSGHYCVPIITHCPGVVNPDVDIGENLKTVRKINTSLFCYLFKI